MFNCFLRLTFNLSLATTIAVALMLPLAGLTYADDPLAVNDPGDDGDVAPGDGTCETGNGNGICTLRAAIEEANGNTAITHTISFSIAGAGPHTFTPLSALPPLTHPATINGLTQPGASCNSPLIEIDGSNVPASVDLLSLPNPSAVTPPIGLELRAGNSTIRGLSIYDFDDTATVPVFGTVIDEVGSAIVIDNSDNNFIECNFIGTDAGGATAAPNQVGISVGNGSNNVITGNLISANGDGGRQSAGVIVSVEPVDGGESSGNQIINNYIGTDKNGTADLGNEQDGILLINARNTVISSNLISGNGDDGIDITDVSTYTVSISGFPPFNYSLACNSPPCATGNIIENNSIGLDINGGAMGNGKSGIEIKNGENNRIYSNTVAHNGYQGVEINELTAADDVCTKGTTPCTLSNTITANSIYSNTELGIDLTANSAGGVTPNGSGPNGANRLQNYPVLSSARTTTTQLIVSGALTSSVSSNFMIELFANGGCDSSGHGEGQKFVVSDTVATDGSGEATFLITTTLPGATQISATATDSGGNTSEFSACLSISDSGTQQSVYLPVITKDT